MVKEKEMQAKGRKFWLVILILALAAYTVKNIFVGADIDEGYGIMVGYRLAKGDRLLLEMWEPHQTSAIFTALFIRPFLLLTGGVDFLNLYLRVVFFIVHGLIAVFFYRTLRRTKPDLDRNGAVLMALLFYVTSPKSIFVPEYSNLHLWFFVLMVLCLMRYYCPGSADRGRLRYLMLAGACLACDVLAYPSMAVLFVFCVGFILLRPVGSRWKECLVYAAPCVLGAAVFLGYLLSYMEPGQILETVQYVLGESSHQVPLLAKLLDWAGSFGRMAVLMIGAAGIAWVLKKVFPGWKVPFSLWTFLVLMVFQVGFWLFGSFNAIHPQILYPAVSLAGIVCYCRSGKREKAGFYVILLTFVSYFAVLALSNWSPILLNPYLFMGMVGGLLCWSSYLEAHAGEYKKGLLSLLCLILVLGNAFGYCYLIIGGDESHSPIYNVRGYNHRGLRAGIFTSYMTAYRYNQNAEIWAEAVPEGSRVLYVGPSQFYCMLGDCIQSCPDTISSLVYDERLTEYWKRNPDRYPDVVVVESWFGEIRTVEEDSFIMQWIRNDFKPSKVVEYPYITVFYQ